MQSFSHGMRKRLTMNPGRSFVTTLVLPTDARNSTVALCAHSAVCRPSATSTSFISGAGLQ